MLCSEPDEEIILIKLIYQWKLFHLARTEQVLCFQLLPAYAVLPSINEVASLWRSSIYTLVLHVISTAWPLIVSYSLVKRFSERTDLQLSFNWYSLPPFFWSPFIIVILALVVLPLEFELLPFPFHKDLRNESFSSCVLWKKKWHPNMKLEIKMRFSKWKSSVNIPPTSQLSFCHPSVLLKQKSPPSSDSYSWLERSGEEPLLTIWGISRLQVSPAGMPKGPSCPCAW